MSTTDKPQTKPRRLLTLGKEDVKLNEINLIDVQKESWQYFNTVSLKETLEEFFPIDDYTGKKFTLYFEDLFSRLRFFCFAV